MFVGNRFSDEITYLDIAALIKKENPNASIRKPEPDSYGQVVINGLRFLKGNFLAKVHDGKDHIVYKKSDLVTYFYKETILRPFVPFVESRNGLKLMNHDYVDIIYHLEKNGYTPF